MSDADRPTIDDFLPGRPYMVAPVARFFGVSTETIRRWIAAGRLKAQRVNPFVERTPEPRSCYLIDGGEVRRFYGSDLLDRDRREARVPTPPGELEKRAAKRLRELERVQAAG